MTLPETIHAQTQSDKAGGQAETSAPTQAKSKPKMMNMMKKKGSPHVMGIQHILKEAGNDPQLVSAALMSASGIYATYTVAGNSGALELSGVDKVVNAYRRNLEHIQARKKDEILSQQQEQKESD